MREKMTSLVVSLAIAKQRALRAINEIVENERGDTNFLSILIILGIVLIVAGVFIGFKDRIIGAVNEIVDGFTFGQGGGGL